ncbi:MAG: hypothetical protein JWL59_2200 [Chthoniobacteraceae bacterium]|nr:hypothetical protein [Chthoniobacteraceae bacterium]
MTYEFPAVVAKLRFSKPAGKAATGRATRFVVPVSADALRVLYIEPRSPRSTCADYPLKPGGVIAPKGAVVSEQKLLNSGWKCLHVEQSKKINGLKLRVDRRRRADLCADGKVG